nr:CASP-like protein 4U1 [Lolium perenne]
MSLGNHPFLVKDGSSTPTLEAAPGWCPDLPRPEAHTPEANPAPQQPRQARHGRGHHATVTTRAHRWSPSSAYKTPPQPPSLPHTTPPSPQTPRRKHPEASMAATRRREQHHRDHHGGGEQIGLAPDFLVSPSLFPYAHRPPPVLMPTSAPSRPTGVRRHPHLAGNADGRGAGGSGYCWSGGRRQTRALDTRNPPPPARVSTPTIVAQTAPTIAAGESLERPLYFS